jgi:two-component system response regulator YesN
MHSILVIHHDRAVGRLFETALQGAGYTVYLATRASEGLNFLRNFSIDMLITDLNMPQGAGLDIIAVVQRELPGTKLVCISGEASEFDPLLAAPLLDAVEVLPNPIGVNHLLGAVQRALGGP